jgi:hypothetical protein
MSSCEHINLQYVTGIRAFYPNRTGERVDAKAVDVEQSRSRHAGVDLATARVDALELHLIAGMNMQAGLQGTVPDGVCG